MHRVIVLLLGLALFIPNLANAEKLYACMEKGAAGFKGKEQMKGAFFNANRRFILKYDEISNRFSADEMLLEKDIPKTCVKHDSSRKFTTCVLSAGANILMAFNPSTKEFRWVIFGLDGDDTAISHGTCEDF